MFMDSFNRCGKSISVYFKTKESNLRLSHDVFHWKLSTFFIRVAKIITQNSIRILPIEEEIIINEANFIGYERKWRFIFYKIFMKKVEKSKLKNEISNLRGKGSKIFSNEKEVYYSLSMEQKHYTKAIIVVFKYIKKFYAKKNLTLGLMIPLNFFLWIPSYVQFTVL